MFLSGIFSDCRKIISLDTSSSQRSSPSKVESHDKELSIDASLIFSLTHSRLRSREMFFTFRSLPSLTHSNSTNFLPSYPIPVPSSYSRMVRILLYRLIACFCDAFFFMCGYKMPVTQRRKPYHERE